MTTPHQWVKHTITEVHPLANGDEEPVVIVDPDQQALAEEDAAYGCNVCGEVLSAENLNTECEGYPEDEHL